MYFARPSNAVVPHFNVPTVHLDMQSAREKRVFKTSICCAQLFDPRIEHALSRPSESSQTTLPKTTDVAVELTLDVNVDDPVVLCDDVAEIDAELVTEELPELV